MTVSPIDSRRFPTLARYVERLPDGLNSYPNEQSKAALYIHALEERPVALSQQELPDALVSLVRHPVPLSEWIPSVHFHAIMLAIRDTHFTNTDEFAAWLFERNLRLLSTPLYKVLFLVVSPERLINGAEQRWSAFRRGCTMRVIEKRDREIRMRLQYSHRLFDINMLRGVGEGLRASVAAAGARESTVEVELVSESEVRYRIGWSFVASALSRVF